LVAFTKLSLGADNSTRCIARVTSSAFTMWYRSKTARVLWPLALKVPDEKKWKVKPL
jgi:hypothetical protein